MMQIVSRRYSFSGLQSLIDNGLQDWLSGEVQYCLRRCFPRFRQT
jgi:hypothetical protein